MTGDTAGGQQPDVPGVTRWQPKRVIVEAHQWHRNGDHPADNCQVIKPDPASTTQYAPFLSEGEIVRYYRNPDDPGTRWCGDCGNRMHDHGWIDQGTFGRVVCPGDWVVSLPLSTPGLTAHFPVAADVFAAAYEPAGEPLTSSQCDRLRHMVTEYGDALSAVRRALDLAEELAGPDGDAGVFKAAREALAVLEGSDEESRD